MLQYYATFPAFNESSWKHSNDLHQFLTSNKVNSKLFLSENENKHENHTRYPSELPRQPLTLIQPLQERTYPNRSMYWYIYVSQWNKSNLSIQTYAPVGISRTREFHRTAGKLPTLGTQRLGSTSFPLTKLQTKLLQISSPRKRKP